MKCFLISPCAHGSSVLLPSQMSIPIGLCLNFELTVRAEVNLVRGSVIISVFQISGMLANRPWQNEWVSLKLGYFFTTEETFYALKGEGPDLFEEVCRFI